MPAGFSAINGAWSAQPTAPVSGPNAFGSTSKAQGNSVIYNGIGSRADMGLICDRKAGATLYPMGHLVRCDSSGLNCYIVVTGPAAAAGKLNITVWYIQAGFADILINQDTTVDWANGDTLWTRAQIVGNTLKVFLWRNAEAMPGTATLTLTDNKVTGAGYAGLYHMAAGQSVFVDDFSIDDGTPTISNYADLSGPNSGTTGVASSDFSVTLTVASATDTHVTPSDSSGGGSFTPASITIPAGSLSGTFKYTAGSAGAKSISVTVDNGYTLRGSPINFTASNPVTATAVTLSLAAASGSNNAPVTVTATLNGTLGVATTVTLADTLTSTIAANPLTIPAGSTSASTTLTPTVTGVHSISMTNDQGLTNTGSPQSYTVSTNTGNIPVDDPGLYWSPLNWDTINPGTFGVSVKSKQTAACGAYLKFIANNTANVSLTIDGSPTAGIGTNRPVIAYSVNSGPVQTSMISGGSGNVSIATGLSASAFIEVWLLASDELSGDRWGLPSTSPTNVLRINQIVLDAGGTVSLPTLRPKRAAFYADSIGEGVRSGRTTTYPASHARSAAWNVCRALNAEYGIIAYGALGWEQTGDGNVPQFVSSWNLHSDSRPRSFAETLDYVFVMLGFNNGATPTAVANWLASARPTFGASTWIFIVSPPSGRSAAAMATGVANYKAANPSDLKVAFLDFSDVLPTAGFDNFPSATEWCVDGVHPDVAANAIIGAAITSKAQAAIAGAVSTSATRFAPRASWRGR